MRRWTVGLTSLIFLLSACDSEKADAPPSEVTGVILEIEGEGSDITAFTLRSEGELYEIRIDPSVDYQFDLGHLRQHRTGAEPVVVDLEERDGALYALSIEDA